MRACLIALFIATCTSAEARTLYVNNAAGDDNNGGLLELPVSKEGPLQSISRALEIALPADRIVLTNTGIAYHEQISLSLGRHCGTAQQPFVIDGRGAVLDGSRPVPSNAWQAYRDNVLRFQPELKGYQQLLSNGAPIVRRLTLHHGAPIPEGRPLEWLLQDGWVYFWPEATKLPDDYGLRYAALETGVTLYHVHDVVIRNLVITGFQLDGVNAHDGVRDARLINISAVNNGRSGVAVAGSSRCQVIDSTLSGNGAAQLYAEGLSLVATAGTKLVEDTAPAVVRRGGNVYVDGKETLGEP